jgi:hypothetical protein
MITVSACVSAVLGEMSPYPTVVSVTQPQYSDSPNEMSLFSDSGSRRSIS